VSATASAVLAGRISGDAGRVDKPHRLRDAIVLGIAVGLAAVTAQLIQGSLSDFVFHEIDAPPFKIVPIVGLAGLACGVVIGFMVPQACRANIVAPPHADMARALWSLLRQAESALGTKAAAEDWGVHAKRRPRGIIPAEAAQYKTQATGVGRLLENEASRRHEEVRREGLASVVIEGGLIDQPVSSRVLAR
jgi:F0F1-type ATP synthase membrane subunit c/vacuolar-type H+-ATPase subunit K